jgi:hypothetical protein
MAAGAWWAMSVFAYLKGFAISITGDNLRDNLWAELATWRQKSPWLMQMFEWQAERIFCKESPENWFISARQWSKTADSAQQANTLAGLHAEHTLVLIDEAGDMPAAVTEAADASLSTGKWNRILMAGNPTQTAGPLFEACTTHRHLWHVIEITGDPDDPKRATRIKVDWAREKIAQWGADNPWVLANVFGKFPPVGSDKLFGPEECGKSAQLNLEDVAWKPHARVIGVDPARYGDDKATIFRRQGRMTWRPKEFRNLDTVELANEVVKEIQDFGADATFVDITGMGVGVYDQLMHYGFQGRVFPVNFGENAQEKERFENRRAEMYWRASRWVSKEGGKLPYMPELFQELSAHSYWFGPKLRMCLTSKDDIKVLIQRSPDLADGFVLTFAQLGIQPKIVVDLNSPHLPFQPKHMGRADTEYDIYGQG